MNLGSRRGPKTIKKRCKKGRVKVEAHRDKMSGLNINPLAPAQSKRSFALSVQTLNSIENTSIPAPFVCPFLTFFEPFLEKSQKGSRVPPQTLKKTPKWIPRVPKRSPRIPKWSPKVPPSNTKTKNVYQGCQNGAPEVTIWS